MKITFPNVRRPTVAKPSRKTAIPLLLVVVAAGILAGKSISPHMPYWLAGDPGQHAALTPENALAHIEVDLLQASKLPVPEPTMKKIQTALGLDESADPASWAGPKASATMLPEQRYLIMVDVRDHGQAERKLFPFLSSPTQQVRELWPDRLVIASDTRIVQEVRDRTANPNLTVLADTELYRHAILHRPKRSNAAAFYFVRNQALQPELRDTAALMAGCTPDAYLFGTIFANRQEHLTTDAFCPRLESAEPQRPTLAERTEHAAVPAEANMVLRASFDPALANIAAQIAKLGDPEFPNPLAAFAHLLTQIPASVAKSPPYADPMDAATLPNPDHNLLNQLLSTLEGTVTVATVPKQSQSAFTAILYLSHHNRPEIESLLSQLSKTLEGSQEPVRLTQVEEGWNLDIVAEEKNTTIATITVQDTMLTIRPTPPPDATPWQNPVHHLPPHHTMLYMPEVHQAIPIPDWLLPQHWFVYTSHRTRSEIQHRITVGAANATTASSTSPTQGGLRAERPGQR